MSLLSGLGLQNTFSREPGKTCEVARIKTAYGLSEVLSYISNMLRAW